MPPKRKLGTAEEVKARGLDLLGLAPNTAIMISPSTLANAPLPVPPKAELHTKSTGHEPTTTTARRYLPMMGTFSMPTPPPRTSAPFIVTRFEPQHSAPAHRPAIYDEEDERNRTLAKLVGSAAYYKSIQFRRKLANQKDQVSGGNGTVAELEDVEMADAEPGKEESLIMIFGSGHVRREIESLVMIFGTDNVRRANKNDRFHRRMQRYNKRS